MLNTQQQQQQLTYIELIQETHRAATKLQAQKRFQRVSFSFIILEDLPIHTELKLATVLMVFEKEKENEKGREFFEVFAYPIDELSLESRGKGCRLKPEASR